MALTTSVFASDSIPTIDDTYARSNNVDVIYGAGGDSNQINLRHQPGDVVRYGYLKYVVPGSYSGTNFTAMLKLWFYNNNGAGAVNIWVMRTEHGWLEETLTWSNKPAEITGADTVKVTVLEGATEGFYTIDVTPLLQASESDTISVMLRLAGEYADNVKIATKEDADVSKAPYLHIEKIPGVAVTGVSLDKDSVELNIGGEVTLVAAVAPVDAETKTVTWSTTDAAVATVDANGKVTAKAAGTAIVIVKTDDGNYKDSCVRYCKRQ
ncbi:MAG: Ig domain-containing protein [Bacteroidales bacterium]|nr:Ig domain-containing protein [Bacteroidales bacterium]